MHQPPGAGPLEGAAPHDLPVELERIGDDLHVAAIATLLERRRARRRTLVVAVLVALATYNLTRNGLSAPW